MFTDILPKPSTITGIDPILPLIAPAHFSLSLWKLASSIESKNNFLIAPNKVFLSLDAPIAFNLENKI